jgi:hypothetical protein
MATLKGLTTTQKRVEILKDAIAQIKKGKYIVLASNGFVRGYITEKIEELEAAACTLGLKPKQIQLQDHLGRLIENNECEVCAKGALFLSSMIDSLQFYKMLLKMMVSSNQNNLSLRLGSN